MWRGRRCRFTATGSCGHNILGSFATGLKEWWSSASPLNVWAFPFRNSSAFFHDLRKGLEKMLPTRTGSAYRDRRGSYLCGRKIKMKTKLTSRSIGIWNVHTLMDSTKAYRPEIDSSSCKRTGQIQHSYPNVVRQGKQIKVSWSKPGFFSSDRYSEEYHEAGVGSAVKTYLISTFNKIP